MHILLAIAERGSLIKAAHDLAVSPPVISKAITDLEAAVGARLFDRDRHGAVPTTFGRALINRSVAALDELRQGVKELEFLADPTTGEVMIGGLAAMMGGLLPKVVAELRLAHPRLTFNVTQVLTSPGVYDNLRNRTFDLIIGRLPAQPLDADLVSEKIVRRARFNRGRKGKPAGEAKEAFGFGPSRRAVGASSARYAGRFSRR